MYGDRDDPYAVLSRLGQRLEGTLAPDAVLPTVVQTVRESLKLPYAAIAIPEADSWQVVESGQPHDDPITLPLFYQSESVGELRFSPRAAGESLSAADMRLLNDLARQAGVAVHAARLTRALQRSRERLVTAREEERRRLRRDLHDGLGPQLASQTMKLEAVRDLLTADPSRAESLIDDLIQQSQNAIADIRRLVYALRPPALDEFGLLGAIREQALHYTSQRLTVTIDAPPSLPPLPAAVEVAAYRIAQEALTNVARHAQAASCTVHIRIDDSWLILEVCDDGVGIADDSRSGVGLHSMRERAEELGGSFTLESSPGRGTRLMARLPLKF
jgi:signal transduction histidine kinase